MYLYYCLYSVAEEYRVQAIKSGTQNKRLFTADAVRKTDCRSTGTVLYITYTEHEVPGIIVNLYTQYV